MSGTGIEGLDVGLAGCGRWGGFILRDLKSLGCRVAVVARSEPSVARAREHGADSIVDRIEALPGAIRGAVVATPTTRHAESIERLLGRGIPIFCEKPLTDDPAAARRILSLAGGRVFVMDKWRYHPGIEALAAIARSGELGPVVSLRTERLGWGIAHDDVDAVWVLAPHDLAIALEILGDLPGPETALGEIHGGTPVGLTGVLGPSPRVTIHVSARHPKNQRSVALYCRDGSAMLEDSYAPHVVIRRAAGERAHGSDPEEKREVAPTMPLLAELRAFIEHLAGGPPPRSSAAEGVRIVELLAKLRAMAGFRP